MDKKPLILIGGGGHCKSCIDVIESTGLWEIKGILDKTEELGQRILNYGIIGTDDDINSLASQGNYFLITVGHIKTNAIRKKIIERLNACDAMVATIISDQAYVSKYAQLGKGTIVHHFCLVNAASKIGDYCIINTGVNIEHDCEIGDNTHVSTNSVINGNTKVGMNCFIGSRSVLSNSIVIADNITIGAGSVVIKNISESGVYAGVPSKMIKHG